MGRPKGSKNKISHQIKYTCKVCKKIFFAYPYRKIVKYCSYKCYWKRMEGKRSAFKDRQHSKETKIKISQNNWMLGRKGKESPFWKGGIHKRKDGYVMVKCYNHPLANPAGYVMQHRIIMEEHIGRYLYPQEQVHHINKIKNDNRIDNLYLCANDKEHKKFHKIPRDHKGKFIKSILLL